MQILQNKFIINHKSDKNNSKRKTSMIFHLTASTTTSAATTTAITAAIMIFMQAIVSVNTTTTAAAAATQTNILDIRKDTEITRTTAETEEAFATETWLKTLFDLSKNPIIAQQSPKISATAKTRQMPPAPTLLVTSGSSSSSSLNSLPLTDATETSELVLQPKVMTAKTSAPATASSDCKSLTGTWGDVDPNIFYICDAQTKQRLQLRCPEGTGFFLGLGYSGCIPYEQWPACIASGQEREQVTVCDSQHMQQPWESINPNKFYVCLKESIEPTILNCEPGKGFVHAIVSSSAGGGGKNSHDSVSSSEIVGCANWEKWRNFMHCNDYY